MANGQPGDPEHGAADSRLARRRASRGHFDISITRKCRLLGVDVRGERVAVSPGRCLGLACAAARQSRRLPLRSHLATRTDSAQSIRGLARGRGQLETRGGGDGGPHVCIPGSGGGGDGAGSTSHAGAATGSVLSHGVSSSASRDGGTDELGLASGSAAAPDRSAWSDGFGAKRKACDPCMSTVRRSLVQGRPLR